VPYSLVGFTGNEKAGFFSVPLSIKLGAVQVQWKCVLMSWEQEGKGILGADFTVARQVLVDLRNHCLWGETVEGAGKEVMVIEKAHENGGPVCGKAQGGV